MPTEVYEDSIDLEIGLIEAENPRPDGGEAHRRSYPYPVLHPVPDRAVARTFPTVVLENAYLRATFVPALGGRLLRLYDKSMKREILPAERRLMPEDGGPRGAILRAGIQVLTGPEDRHGSLGEAPFILDPPADDAAIGVTFFGLDGDLSFHAHWTLEQESACIALRLSTFNRSLSWRKQNAGVRCGLEGEFSQNNGGMSWSGGLGFEGSIGSANHDGKSFTASRYPRESTGELAPRQVDKWQLSIYPQVARAKAARGPLSLSFGDEALVVRSVEGGLNSAPGHKIVIQLESGETLESVIEEWPTQQRFSLGQLPSPLARVAVTVPGASYSILDSEGFDKLTRFDQWEAPPVTDALPFNLGVPQSPVDLRDLSDEALDMAQEIPAVRSPAFVASAMRASRWPNTAAHLLESALLFNAEDSLAWWLRALSLRRSFESEDNSQELLNAHFLAPLEPALRAESFLSMPVSPNPEPAAILNPLADFPEAFLEVACLLLDAGLNQDAQRWIDESLRHADLALLRYLLAHLYLGSGKMDVEAAQEVAMAGKLSDGPPYPWRRAEVRAVRALAERFPTDQRLHSLTALMDALLG